MGGSAISPLADTLFGDRPLEDWPAAGSSSGGFPWTAFVEARDKLAEGAVESAKASWREVIAAPGLESRHYLQAWQFLRAQGEPVPEAVAHQILGFVAEVALPEGLDLLAVYADGSARYYNHAGGGVVIDEPAEPLITSIQTLLAACVGVAAQIGPWLDARRGPPAAGDARLNFLTPSGLHFGEGRIAVLEADPLGSLVFGPATTVMTELVALTERGS